MQKFCQECGSPLVQTFVDEGKWYYRFECPRCKTEYQLICGDYQGGSVDDFRLIRKPEMKKETYHLQTQQSISFDKPAGDSPKPLRIIYHHWLLVEVVNDNGPYALYAYFEGEFKNAHRYASQQDLEKDREHVANSFTRKGHKWFRVQVTVPKTYETPLSLRIRNQLRKDREKLGIPTEFIELVPIE